MRSAGSAGAVLLGFVAVVALSLGTDQVLHMLRVYPPWGEPMRHALVGGLIGTVLGIAGAVATIPLDLSPSWYPIAVAAGGLPCAWMGGALHGARRPPARRRARSAAGE